MTRKDYKLIAEAFRTIYKEIEVYDDYSDNSEGVLYQLELELISRLLDDNPRFDPAQFRAAAKSD